MIKEKHTDRLAFGMAFLLAWAMAGCIVALILYEAEIFEKMINLYITSLIIPFVFVFLSYIIGFVVDEIPSKLERWENND